MIRDMVVENDSPEMSRTKKVFAALEEVCYEFDPGLWHFVCPLIFTLPYTTALWGLFFCQILRFYLQLFVIVWYNNYKWANFYVR